MSFGDPGGSVTRAALLVLLLAACAEPEVAAPTGGGAGGAGGSGGAPGCVDHRGESGCLAEGATSGCGQGELCGLPVRGCGASERCCTLATQCRPRAEGRPGGAVCDEDSDCGGGVCLPVAGRGLCFRACDALLGLGCPVGTHCSIVSLDGGASVSTCLGGTREAPDPLTTICRVDRECPEGRVCRIRGYEAAYDSVEAPVGLCAPPVGTEATELGQRCDPPPGTPGVEPEQPYAFSSACPAYGACTMACDFTPADVCACSPAQFAAGECRSMRCTRPCRGDPDCPNRYICSSAEGVGDGFRARDESFRTCALPGGPQPETGCRDELDCCEAGVFRGHGTPCCNWNGPAGACFDQEIPEERTHCGVRLDAGLPGRFHTVCRRPAERSAPGAPCDADAACVSGLCLPGPDGKLCSSPCEQLVDRCPSILPGTQCCPTAFGDGLCVEACRADCPAEPACTLN